MSVTLYYLSIIISIIMEFLFFMLIGFQLLLLVLRLLDKKCSRISLPKKKRIIISLLVNLTLSIVYGIYLYTEPYRYDAAFEIATKNSNLSLPFYRAIDIQYPKEKNVADDFGVDKTLKFFYSPSQTDLYQLERLCQSDERWTKEGKNYRYQDEIFEAELKLDVIIDVENNKVYTHFLKW